MQLGLDGRPVFADTGGVPFDAGRPVLVFIHGAQHDHFVWKPFVTHFAASHAVLAIDLPGHGRSGGPALPDIVTLADWLLALLEQVGAGDTATLTLAGHSMGSLIALEAVARHPDRIRVTHLCLFGTAVPMPVAPALLQAAQEAPAKAMALINRWSHSQRAWLGACGSHGLWLPGINQRIMERQPVASLRTDLAACNAYQGGETAAARLTCPTTLIAGGHDRMTSPRNARRFAALLGDRANLVELPGVGHAMLAEAPAAAIRALDAALR
jgi:pimeloyl-ACP methyl ester carboxylesterase